MKRLVRIHKNDTFQDKALCRNRKTPLGVLFFWYMGWKIVEIETNEYIQLYLNNLLIKRKDEKIMINLRDIDTLILKNERSTLSIRLINALVNNQINIILMNHLHIPNTSIFPIVGHHSSLKIFGSQINWTTKYKGHCWRTIIQNKINNQSQVLQKLQKEDLIYTLIDEVKVFDISNREGHAAKIYWHTMFGLDFYRDQNAVKNIFINNMLNYGYAILRSLVIRAIYKKGLDPRISFFHKSFTNYFALASDVMEPFRPLVDLIVYKFREAEAFTIDIREELINVLDYKVKIAGKKYFIEKAIEMVLDNIVKGQGWLWVELCD